MTTESSTKKQGGGKIEVWGFVAWGDCSCRGKGQTTRRALQTYRGWATWGMVSERQSTNCGKSVDPLKKLWKGEIARKAREGEEFWGDREMY